MSLDWYPGQRIVCIERIKPHFDFEYFLINVVKIPLPVVGEIYTISQAEYNETYNEIFLTLKEIPSSDFTYAKRVFKPVEYNQMKTLRGLLVPIKGKERESYTV